jgi:dUTP pyrophosphatase
MSIDKCLLDTKYTLKYFKAKDVKTPEKFGNAAGWDFFIPNKLTIFDFTKDFSVYINDFIKENFIPVNANDVVKVYFLPLEFEITMNGKTETWIIVVHEKSDGSLLPVISRKPGSNAIAFFNGGKTTDEELELLKTAGVNKITILPGGKILIPSGIHVNLPNEVMLVAENKSGIAAKRGLIKGAQVIDVDYQGEIHINLINPTKFPVTIKPGEKIVQFVPYFQPIMTDAEEFDSKESLYAGTKSVRGEGGFGSSGN